MQEQSDQTGSPCLAGAEIHFECWHKDRHDLTPQVAVALSDALPGGSPLIEVKERPEEPKTYLELPPGMPQQWRFLVTCTANEPASPEAESEDPLERRGIQAMADDVVVAPGGDGESGTPAVPGGDDNVFDYRQLASEEEVAGDRVRTVRGLPALPEDLAWSTLAGDVSPTKATARLDAALKALVANLAVLTTLASGFGIFKTIDDGFQLGYLLLAIPVFFAAASVGIGMWVMRPRTKDVASVGNLTALKSYVEGVIRGRAKGMAWATGLFVCSLASAPLALFATAWKTESTQPTISASWAFAADGKASIKTKVAVDRIPDDGKLEVIASATSTEDTAPVQLLHAVDEADKARKGEVSATFPGAESYASLRITAEILDGDGQRQDLQTADITPQPTSAE